MGYGKRIYEEACAELARRKTRAEQTAEMGLQNFYRQCPRAREIREEMAVNSARAAKTVISGGDVRRELEKLKATGLALKAEFSALLSQNGFTEREITPQYICEKCRDTGFQDGRMCSCLKALQRQMAYEKLCISPKAPLTPFHWNITRKTNEPISR